MNRIPRRALSAALSLLASALVATAGCGSGDPPQSTPAATLTPTPDDPGPTSAPPGPVRRVFPVVGGQASYGRTHHGYPATDIIAACGLAYIAPVDGVVHEVQRVDRHDPTVSEGAYRGGLSVSILGEDGVRYYGSHFSAIDAGVVPGSRVAAGDHIATVGRTGDAGACHVHFGLSLVCADGDWFVRRGVIWPWPYLDSWRGGGNAEPLAELLQWRAANGCPTQPAVEP